MDAFTPNHSGSSGSGPVLGLGGVAAHYQNPGVEVQQPRTSSVLRLNSTPDRTSFGPLAVLPGWASSIRPIFIWCGRMRPISLTLQPLRVGNDFDGEGMLFFDD
jgi:hypothetical protein